MLLFILVVSMLRIGTLCVSLPSKIILLMHQAWISVVFGGLGVS